MLDTMLDIGHTTANGTDLAHSETLSFSGREKHERGHNNSNITAIVISMIEERQSMLDAKWCLEHSRCSRNGIHNSLHHWEDI